MCAQRSDCQSLRETPAPARSSSGVRGPLPSWDTGAPMETITLATCAAWPALSTSDACLAAALRARGRNVVSAPWNDAFEPFAHGPVVIRSTWDYHETPDAYVAWLDRLPTGRAFNPPSLIRWNLAKTYVLDLAQRGAPVPRSRAAVAEPGAVAAAMTALGLHDAVIKPLIGASGFGVERVARGGEAGALARAMARKPTAQVLVQEFLTCSSTARFRTDCAGCLSPASSGSIRSTAAALRRSRSHPTSSMRWRPRVRDGS